MRKQTRKFMFLATTLALSAQAAAQAPAQPQDESIRLITAHTRPIQDDPGRSFSGAAWKDLIADGAGAQFVMVGEQHGSDSINRFERALHSELARRGFTHSALEVGPYSTAFAERLIRSGNGKLQSYISADGHGFTIPFLFFAGEAEMAEEMVASSPDRSHALFGLDQEFVGAAPILAAELRALAMTPSEKRAAAQFAIAADRDPFLVAKMDDAHLVQLDQAFRRNALGLAVIDAIRVSARIYRPFFAKVGSGYLSNLERETYMKRNFVRQFDEVRRRDGKAPKVFFKFGGYHAMRGLSGTDVPSLANFLAEWGLPQNYRVMNLMVDCIGGEALNPQTNKAAPCKSYFPSDGLLYRAIASGPRVQIVDLRALRPLLGRINGGG